MGNPSRPELHPFIVEWSGNYKSKQTTCIPEVNARIFYNYYENDLKNYFRLCALARNKNALPFFRSAALQDVFGVRFKIENSIISSINRISCSADAKVRGVLGKKFFGSSKKQGTSLRMPLASCNPTKLCAPGCYAHDVLDAAPFAVIRGAMNGWLAMTFEKSDQETRKWILKELESHSMSAIRNADRELKSLPLGFERRAFIRFSHVGEITAYPNLPTLLRLR